MKFFLVTLLATQCLASDVKLAWNASLTAEVTNYVLYAHTNILSATNSHAALVKRNVGTNLTATVEDLQAGQWSFAVSAVRNTLESELSNVLNVEVPKPPANMRTVVVQYGGTVTNFFDTGYFRLRLP